MEMTWEQWKAMKKALRRNFSSTGWTLVIYYLIMNVAVFLCVFIETLLSMMVQLTRGDFDAFMDAALSAQDSAWGYFLAAAVGLLILLLWKKPRFWKEEVWAKGKPMKPGAFLSILCIFMSGQAVYQIGVTSLELILNLFGLSVIEGMEAMAMDMDNFGMFLYAGILAPITEEILFRGLIQKSLQPYGKKFAIFCSAFCFGIFHGNLIQTPYAFLVGLVLGYVASEYSIGWAMVLHMFNNLVIADVLNRLTQDLPEEVAGLIILAIVAVFAIGAIIIAIVKRKEISDWLQAERMNRTCLRCFFSCAGMIVLMVLMGLNILMSLGLMITPI